VNGYGRLKRVEGGWIIEKHFQPQMPDNDFTGMQKNLCCWEWEGQIYGAWDYKTVVLLDRGDKCRMEYLENPPTWPYGEIRGGTSPLPFYGKWLRFFHSRVWDRANKKPWRYHIGALVMEPHPPFNVLHVSRKPILSGDESGDPMIWHYKPDVCIPYGAIEQNDGWLLSLGINDAHCAVLKLKEGDLNL